MNEHNTSIILVEFQKAIIEISELNKFYKKKISSILSDVSLLVSLFIITVSLNFVIVKLYNSNSILLIITNGILLSILLYRQYSLLKYYTGNWIPTMMDINKINNLLEAYPDIKKQFSEDFVNSLRITTKKEN